MAGLNRVDFEKTIENKESHHTDYNIENSMFTIFPFFDNITKEVIRSAAMITTLAHTYKENHKHTVIVAFHNGEYYAWCGDSFISGKKEKAIAMDGILKVAISKTEKNSMAKLYGSGNDKPCRFWISNECSHIFHVYSMIYKDPSILDKLEQMLSGNSTSLKNRSPRDMLKKLQFKKHTLLQGDKGSGKTTLAYDYAKQIKAKIFFIGGNASLEASDFIGEYIPINVSQSSGKGTLFESEVNNLSMAWKDGPLSEAIRYANSGKKAILIFDEILRVSQRELSPLISALSPVDGKYQLGTRRAINTKDDLAEEEILQCPIENFWLIGTTNVGAAYQVDKIDEAFADRLRIIQMNSEAKTMEMILRKTSIEKKYCTSCVNSLMSFYRMYDQRRKDGSFKKLCNLRHLKEAIEFSVDEKDIKETLWETRLAWVNTDADGQPREEQLEELEKIINKAFES